MAHERWVAIGGLLLGFGCGARTLGDTGGAPSNGASSSGSRSAAGSSSGSVSSGATGSSASSGATGSGTGSSGGTGSSASSGSSRSSGGSSGLDAGCGDLLADPLNCGACGHDCMGAVCSSGTCGKPPIVLATHQTPTYLALDGSAIYWVNALPQVTGAAGSSQIMWCAVGGCSDQPSQLWADLYPVVGLAVRSGRVWWPTGPGGLTATFGSNPSVLTCLEGAGCPGLPTQLFAFDGAFYGFAVNDEQVYVGTNAGDVRACPLTGCGGVSASLASGPYGVYLTSVNSTDLFWADGQGTIFSCPSGGCGDGGAAHQVTGPSNAVQALVADPKNVYWIEGGTATGGGKLGPVTAWSGGAVRQTTTGGFHDTSGTPTTLATYSRWLGGGALASDGAYLYWSAEDISGNFGTIVRAPIGGGGKPVVLATTATVKTSGYDAVATRGLALDATHVYWTDPGHGMVMALPK